MKLIKMYTAVTVLIALTFVVAFKCSNTKKEEKLLSIEIPEKGEILPKEQWMEAIIGEWKVGFTIQNPTEIIDVTGDIIYKKDNELVEFYNTLHYKFYFHKDLYKVKISDEHLAQVGKAVRSGNISLDNTFSKGHCLNHYNNYSCNNTSTPNSKHNNNFKEMDFCEKIHWVLVLIGDHEDYSEYRYELLTFSKNEILIKFDTPEIEKPVLISYKRTR